MNIQRWEISQAYGQPVMEQDARGDFVRFEDHKGETDRLRKELRECRELLTDLIAAVSTDDPNACKAAADWLANWNGDRL